MKKFFLTALIPVVLFSCDTKRPDVENLEYSLTVNSIQNGANVEVLDGETVVVSGTTDESGAVTFSGLNAVKTLTVKVCKGTATLVSSADPVAWTGCNETEFTPEDKQDVVVTVDFLSTFISKYDSETATEEWQTYLDITTLPSPALQSSLTDASKRYLWYQGIAKIAENVSKANSVTPETMYSTENLLNLLLADLADDNIINGSTKAKFGTLNVEALILKSVLADAIPEVSETFKTADLKTWTDKIRYSDAKFLGGSGEGVDAEKPVIEIENPEDGSVIFGNVEVKATATDNVKVTGLNCTVTGDGMPELVDTDEDDDKFTAVFDSKLIADGKITIKCIASDGTSLSEKEITVTVSNSNQVTLSAFVTNPLTLWDSVTVYDSSDNKVLATSFEEEEAAVISLAPGTFRIVFKGGVYAPVFLNDETIEFDSTLETRVTVKAGEKTSTVATPLTTLREHLYRALIEKDDSKAETKSFELISEHIDSDFPLYIEPVSKNQLTENSKYYIVLASLERLAVLIGERHDPPLEKGAVTIEQVLKALADDLGAEDKAVLDGAGKINQFAVDSYLFRYWYAIAVKLFLESEENLTGLKFSDLQTVISNISMDESVLFPESDKAKKVTDKPPVISEKQFKRSFETGFQDYSVSNIIYANDEVFSVKFKALPDESGDLVIDELELTGDIEVQSLSDINEEGIYTAEIKFPVIEDGDKTILITAVDNAENVGNATLQAVKDTVKPVIDNLGGTLPLNVTTPLAVPYAVTEINPLDSLFAVTASGEIPAAWTSLAPAVLTGDITVTDAMITDDGSYTLHFKTVDEAGNETAQTKSLTFDRIIPTATFTTIPEINENGFIAQNSIAITIIAEDNITPETDLIHEFFNGVSWVENISETKNIWNMQNLSEQLYSTKYRVKDLAGNKSADIDVIFTVDTVNPVITTNKTALESKAYRIDDAALMLNSTCTDTNILTYTYSINSGEPVAIVVQSTPLLNNADLHEGTNTVEVTCTDKAGNESTEEILLLIDNTPPRVESVVSAPSGRVCALSHTLTVNTADDISRPVTAKYYYNFGSYPVSNVYSSPVLESGDTTLQVPGATDNYYTTLTFSKENHSADISVVVVDQAGNESDPHPVNWTLDRKPPFFSLYVVDTNLFAIVNKNFPLIHSDDFDYDNFQEYIDQKAAEAGFGDFVSVTSYKNNVVSHTFTVIKDVNTFQEGECANYVCGGENGYYAPCRVCAHTATYPDIFDFKVTFKDSCNNTGVISDCAEDDYSCLAKSINVAIPPLYVSVNQTNSETRLIEIQSEGANIQSCKIYKNSVFIQNCQLTQGIQQLDTTSFSEGYYDVTVTSKFSTGTNISTRTARFLVDRTQFRITVNVDTSKLHYLTFPALNYDVAIASGLKELKLYLSGHMKNKNYVSISEAPSYNCNDSNQCTSTTVKRLVNTTSKTKGAMLPPKSGSYYTMGGGWWTQIYYEAVPNFGETKTGTIVLGSIWGSGIGFMQKPEQDTHMTVIGNKVNIFESILDIKIHHPKVILLKGSCSENLCRTINPNDQYRKTFYKVRTSYTCKDADLTDVSVQTFYKATLNMAGHDKYEFRALDCRDNNDCIGTAPECHWSYLRCVPDYDYFTFYEEEGYTCPSDPYDFLINNMGCFLQRPFWYYPKDMYIDISYLEFRPKNFYMKDYVNTLDPDKICVSGS